MCLAKRIAAACVRNAPLAELSQSRATHRPVLLRPIANTGMASLRMELSGRLNARGPDDLYWREDMLLSSNRKINMCAGA